MKNRVFSPETTSRDGVRESDGDGTNISAEALEQLRDRAESLIAQKPALSLGIALAIGLGIGWWVKRK